ncbi:hypothetical protein [Nocardia rhizosphaerihabitans]|uniref:Uncharacterized protein n=1 Tax=Nocardia rhizosphaerihabitans TaxID=1691570 RepID=A0ABQ2KV16_9NOCA|nr:hypothetical protein [Nocardia rhizosphaerihabitans]GGN94236.1 hypothetical protein GCM10011610_56970 [Nocardia rhizosphaerihabitans]
MIDEHDNKTPVIRTEVVGTGENDADETHLHRIDMNWSLEYAVAAFLDELSAARSVTTPRETGGEILVEATLAGRSFPSMYFDHRLLNRLASTGMPLRIKTAPRTTT